MNKDLENRKDIDLLMNKFYGKIRQDSLLGPIFNHHIAEDEWPAHLVKIGDFWETNLFGVPKFKGNPTAKHIKVDQAANYGITQKHFGQWLHLWFQTIDDLFEGSRADRAKNAARMMGTRQFLAIWHNRPENKHV